jgi:hypothetical protein
MKYWTARLLINIHYWCKKLFKLVLPGFEMSGGELFELRLLDTQLVNTFWPIQAVITFLTPVLIR